MIVVRTIEDLTSIRSTSAGIGFVPTMGALHEGHLSLIRKAASQNESAWVSIFVNPLQFGAGEDFSKYPRTEEADFELARSAGCSVMFAPDVATMRLDSSTTVHVSKIAYSWEGQHRPGHFVGVATIVLKLFNIVRPNVAYFGWKDFQQCAVIRRMVDDLFVPVSLEFCETVREHDGLAMSSRNRYLSAEERAIASLLWRTLADLRTALKTSSEEETQELLARSSTRISQGGFALDYLAWVDGNTLEPITQWRPFARLIVAAKIGTTRLIDNLSTD